MEPSCIFCDIVSGKAPSHQIWSDDEHVAFLSIFPNTEGVAVVIPKEHHASYAFALPDEKLVRLVLATKRVALLIDATLEDVGRTAMVFEGFGVDHVHAKLFPMHGTAAAQEWMKISSPIDTYFDTYEGYISSHDAARADDGQLAELAKRLLEKAAQG